jgi:hypothetical protein
MDTSLTNKCGHLLSNKVAVLALLLKVPISRHGSVMQKYSVLTTLWTYVDVFANTVILELPLFQKQDRIKVI